MSPPSLRTRIRNGSLLMLVIALILGALAIPTVHRLGRSIRETLYRNYTSIEASQHMLAAIYNLQLAEANGIANTALTRDRAIFTHWINIELNDITEVGETELASEISRRGRR